MISTILDLASQLARDRPAMASNETDSDDRPDDEIRELLEETASERRWNGLMFIGAGLLATAFAWSLLWLTPPPGQLGNVERIIVLILGYGGYFLGALSTLSGLALFLHSLTLDF